MVFPDPYTNAPQGEDNVFPKSWWLPKDGVKRGTVKNHFGDPLTPGYPAKGRYNSFLNIYFSRTKDNIIEWD